MNEIIDEPTHILPTSNSCIDLIFTSEKNFVSDSGVLPYLYPRCHHQNPFVKINVIVLFPPAYQRKIWDFSIANLIAIKEAINSVDWERKFTDLSTNQCFSFD